MGRAEVGSTKHLSNKLKSKGLQRLRWYCQVCEKQCRDENGFKMHTQSESHVRQILVVGEDPKKFINRYSDDFLKDFIQLLKTAHGTKQVQINHFYQEYISNKEHIHMNATKWPSLTEFAKHLGKEGICRVEEVEGKGIHIAWIDNSPDALRRQEQLRRKEMMEKGDEEREQMIIREQIRRARREREKAGKGEDLDEEERDRLRELRIEEGKKVVIAFSGSSSNSKGKKEAEGEGDSNASFPSATSAAATNDKKTLANDKEETKPEPTDPSAGDKQAETSTNSKPPAPPATVAIKMGTVKPQPKNVFKQAKKLFDGKKKNNSGGGEEKQQPKKMSEAERIMREELQRKRTRDVAPGLGFGGPSSSKKQRRS